MSYLFTSERLGFRNWTAKDLPELTALCANTEVMKHFPKPLTEKESKAFLERLQKHYADRGYNYFAVEIKTTKELIGFIGLAYQDYCTAFTPAIDIGWRLTPTAWGKGYATEGAKRCLEFGFKTLKLDRIIATCPSVNTASEQVMQRIGMQKAGVFKHPKLSDFPQLENCLCYEIDSDIFLTL